MYKQYQIMFLILITFGMISFVTTFAQTTPQEKIILSDARLASNMYGDPISSIYVNQMIFFTANVTNPQTHDQPYKFYEKVTYPDGHLDNMWMTGTLVQNETTNPSQSFTPNITGQYTVQMSVIDPTTNKTLAQTNPLVFNVLDKTQAVQSKIPSWVKNIFIWYGQGQVSEDELLGAIKFLVQSNIIHLN